MPRLQLGIEFNAVVEEINPLATLFVMTETVGRPGLFLGTSSDRIGSPSGTTAWYATAVKNVPALRLSPYASLNWSEWDDGFNVPFGAGLDLGRGLSTRWMYDGERSHALLDVARDGFGVSLMWVWLERFGVSFSGGF